MCTLICQDMDQSRLYPACGIGTIDVALRPCRKNASCKNEDVGERLLNNTRNETRNRWMGDEQVHGLNDQTTPDISGTLAMLCKRENQRPRQC